MSKQMIAVLFLAADAGLAAGVIAAVGFPLGFFFLFVALVCGLTAVAAARGRV